MRSIAARFESSHAGTKVLLNSGASAFLARQIRDGAPVDIFLSADARSMDLASTGGRLAEGTRRELVWNALAVVVPSDSSFSPSGPEDLLEDPVRRIALCSEAVPLGRYARTWLRARGLLGGIDPRAVRPPDARAALALAEAGAVDVAIVYRSDAIASANVRLAFEVPLREAPRIAYSVAAIRDGPNPEIGSSLLEYLVGSESMRVFAEAGFRVDAGVESALEPRGQAGPR